MFTAPEIMLSSIFCLIRRDSPVMLDSSKSLSPLIIIPSIGTVSPGLINRVAPIGTVSASTSLI